MDLNSIYQQLAQLKQQATQPQSPDLGQIAHVTAAGINVQNGDPRLRTGFNENNLRPDELAKWQAYVAKQQQQGQ